MSKGALGRVLMRRRRRGCPEHHTFALSLSKGPTNCGRVPLRRGAILAMLAAAAVIAVVFFAPLPDEAQAHELGTPTNVTVTSLPGALKVSWNRVADESQDNSSPHRYAVRWRVKDPQSEWFGDRDDGRYSIAHGKTGCTEDTDCSFTLSNSFIRADSYWRSNPGKLPTALLVPGTTYEVQVSAYGRFAPNLVESFHYHEWSSSAEGSPLATDVTLSGLELVNATTGSDASVDWLFPFGDRLYVASMLQEVTSIRVKPSSTSYFEVNIAVKLGESGTPQTVRHLGLSSAIDIPPNADPGVPHEIYLTLTAVNDSTNTATYRLRVYQHPPVSFGETTIPDLTFTQGVEVRHGPLPSGSDDYLVTYTATGLPAGLSLSSVHRTIVGTPTAATIAPVTVTYTGTGDIGSSASLTFDVTVAPPVEFDAAQLAAFNKTYFEYTIGQAGRISETLPEAAGGHGDLTYHLTYRVKEESGWVDKTIDADAPGFSFDTNTRVLTSDTGASAPSEKAWYSVDYWAEDENGARATAPTIIAVWEAPSLPEIDDKDLTVGVAASFELPEASGGSLREQLRLQYKLEPSMDYKLSPDVDGLSVAGYLTIAGTPLVPGSTEMTYTATDSNGVSDSRTFTINVANGPNAPSSAPGSLEATQETSGPNGARVTASWDAVTGATGYVVQVIEAAGSFPDKPTNSAPDGVALSIATDGSLHWVVIIAIGEGDYRVRVAGKNADGVGPWSEEASFTVQIGGV